MKFEDTTINNLFSLTMLEKTGGIVNLREEHSSLIIKVTIEAMSDYAQEVKNKENPIAIVIDDLKGKLLLAAVVRFHEGEGKMPGNWSYEWTFDEEDIKDCSKYLVSENTANNFFAVRAKDAPVRFSYNSPSYMYLGAQAFADCLINWLDTNAKPGEEVEVDLDGYFKASVIVEDKKKIMSFSPDGAIKRLIKDDASLETR